MSKKVQTVLVAWIAVIFCLLAGSTHAADGSLADKLRQANKVINQDKHLSSRVSQSNQPLVQQDDEEYEYDGYIPLKIPFTSTERYNYYDQFLQGLQLENYFDHASECIDATFYTFDDYAYYQNNVTLQDWWFDRYLNLTGAIGGNFSETIPECYQFYFSFKTAMENRAENFDYSWGNYALAFMFNQMGNAISFQTIFQTIGESRENQMYEEIYYQYGVLIRLIFDFLPLEDGSLQSYIADFLDINMPNQSRAERIALEQGLLKMVRVVNDFQDENQAKLIGEQNPIVKAAPAFEPWTFLDGFINGAIDVFPEDSLFDLCRDNSTSIDDILTTLSDLNVPEDNLEVTQEVSELLKFPYGFTFSCYFALSGVFWSDTDANADGELTEEEALEQSVIFVNDITTNVLFNLGFMYNDVKDYTLLEDSDTEYWKKIGNYSGDFFIRIFWRESFATVFEY